MPAFSLCSPNERAYEGVGVGDDFLRTDPTGLGTEWTDDGGPWQTFISGGGIAQCGVSDDNVYFGRAVHNQSAPTGLKISTCSNIGNVNWGSLPWWSDAGLIYKWEDWNNYYFVYIHSDWLGGQASTLYAYKRVGGIDTLLDSAVLPGGGSPHNWQRPVIIIWGVDLTTFEVWARGRQSAIPGTNHYFTITDSDLQGVQCGLYSDGGSPLFATWAMGWPGGEKPVYLTTDDSGAIYPTVVNDVSGIAGMSEDGDGIIHVEAPRVATDLGDGVLQIA